MRVVAVTRLSTAGQKKGHGKERQEREEIQLYANKVGAEIIATWSIQERASVFDRPQFQEVLEKAIGMRRDGMIDALLFGSVDRLSRDPYDGGAICREALSNGLTLLFAAEQLDASREQDQEQIIGALKSARSYINRLKRQTIPARRARADDGKIPNGGVKWPFDYDSESGRATPNPTKAQHVRSWTDVLLTGGTLGDIDRLMQANSVPAPKGGQVWSRSTIARILRDPALKGEFYAEYERMVEQSFFQPSKRVKSTPKLVYQDKQDAILSDDVWQQIQDRLTDNQKLSPRTTAFDYTPLHLLVWCHCGRKAGASTRKGLGHFRCPSCRDRSVNSIKLWDQIKNEFSVVLRNPLRVKLALVEEMNGHNTLDSLQERVDRLTGELGELSNSQDKMLRAFSILNSFSEAKLKAGIDDIEKRYREVQVELTQTKTDLEQVQQVEVGANDLEEMCGYFNQALDQANAEEWKQLLRDYGVKVTLQPPPLEHDWSIGIELSNSERALLRRS